MPRTLELKRVVVTGMGAVTPLGNDIDSFWNSLKAGSSGAKPITRFDPSEFKTKFACEVKNFDPTDYIDRKKARKMDLYTQYAMATAKQAVEDSNLVLETLDKNRSGVIWGTGIGGQISFQNEIIDFVERGKTARFNPFFIPKMIGNIAAGYVSIEYGFRGPNVATVSACASSNHAILEAFTNIQLGKADVMITGGSEASIVETALGGFNAMKALSERNDSPETASRPFDGSRDGFVLGEGGGSLILEELNHALDRGANIYAEVLGGAMTADAYHITAPHPQGEGVKLALRNVLNNTELSTSDVDYINVHGTSTPLGDIHELEAIVDVFGSDAYQLNISSTKSMTGHLLGAAGAVEGIASILAIKHGIVPPTINHTMHDEGIDEKLNLTLNQAEVKDISVALSNTFGFGGHNVTVAFQKFKT